MINELIHKWRTRKIHIKNDNCTWFVMKFKNGSKTIIDVADLISIKSSMEAKRETAFILDEMNNKYETVFVNNIKKINQLI